MPPAKSMYSRPSASQIRAPQARATTRSVRRDAARDVPLPPLAHLVRGDTFLDPHRPGVSHYRNARQMGALTYAMRSRGRLAPMRPLSPQFVPYGWALSAAEIAKRAGIAPRGRAPLRREHAARTRRRRPGRRRSRRRSSGSSPTGTAAFRSSLRAIADYNGLEPENVVLGAGADDLLMLCARAYAGPGDRVAIADEPSYPLYRVAAWVTGADVGDDDPALTFVCRPHNPTGAMVELPAARPLVVDEAYFEYGGETALHLLGSNDVIVVRTFSKAFGLASARVGYALADVEIAAELNERQQPAPISTISRGARARGARGRAARRLGDDRGARAPRRGTALDRARAAARRTRTSSSCRTSGRRSSTRRCSRRGSRCGRRRARSASRCTGRTPTTGCSRRSPRSADERRAGEHPASCRRAGRRCRRARRALSFAAACCESGAVVIAARERLAAVVGLDRRRRRSRAPMITPIASRRGCAVGGGASVGRWRWALSRFVVVVVECVVGRCGLGRAEARQRGSATRWPVLELAGHRRRERRCPT